MSDGGEGGDRLDQLVRHVALHTSVCWCMGELVRAIERLRADLARGQAWIEEYHRTVQKQAEELARVTGEREQLQQWVHDLQAGMYINCVYCGHRYGPDDQVPATMAQALKEHVEQCPKHPMSALRDTLRARESEGRALREALRAQIVKVKRYFSGVGDYRCDDCGWVWPDENGYPVEDEESAKGGRLECDTVPLLKLIDAALALPSEARRDEGEER